MNKVLESFFYLLAFVGCAATIIFIIFIIWFIAVLLNIWVIAVLLNIWGHIH